MNNLLENEQLPDWFQYPEELIELIQTECIDFGPWQLLCGKWLNVRHKGLKERYPNLELVPFARRLDSDDVACFDVSISNSNPKIKIIHDFASSGWEDRGELENFSAWLTKVKLEADEWDEE